MLFSIITTVCAKRCSTSSPTLVLRNQSSGLNVCFLFCSSVTPFFNSFINIFVVHGSWGNKEKRRQFFENYAAEHSFDPLNPDRWYIQPRDKLLATPVILLFYSSSPLLRLF